MTLSCALTCNKCENLDSLIEMSQCKDYQDDCNAHLTSADHKGCENYPE